VQLTTLITSIAELVSLLKENNQRTKHVFKEKPIEEDAAPTPDVTISPPFRRLSLLAAKTPAAKLAMDKWRKEAMADHARDL
jgi:predicted acylesterase/phospholipase RssA